MQRLSGEEGRGPVLEQDSNIVEKGRTLKLKKLKAKGINPFDNNFIKKDF